uniref:ATP synthase F0 subunit 8 n=1 Tax=Ptyas korros TaxID=74367 RepID=UPI0022FD4D4D|nr:ATP synthase F0 subunit 8 [Ptyas korros]WBQ42965.1 ATP synthase F0 subunit 8 [Ptyas korros]
MPQLDTIYILMTYLWTWLVIHLTTQKTKTFLMTMNPAPHLTPKQQTPTMQWL